ncbi:hypothetical protein FRC12_006345 [Ceratobasidium sp. 428]|nr:hypothetical protein FRC12_006345 [Ceratobasidium sp. 428]
MARRDESVAIGLNISGCRSWSGLLQAIISSAPWINPRYLLPSAALVKNEGSAIQ